MGRSSVKKTQHAAALPPIEYVKALRELGARTITTADLCVEFGEREAKPETIGDLRVQINKYLSEATKAVALAAVPMGLIGADLPAGAVVDKDDEVGAEELAAEERERRAKLEYEQTLLASAD